MGGLGKGWSYFSGNLQVSLHIVWLTKFHSAFSLSPQLYNNTLTLLGFGYFSWKFILSLCYLVTYVCPVLHTWLWASSSVRWVSRDFSRVAQGSLRSLNLLYSSHFLKIEFSEHWNMVLFDFNLWNLLSKRHFHPSRKGKAAPKRLCANNKGKYYPHCTVTASRWCFAPIWLIWWLWVPLPCIIHEPFSIIVTILDFTAFPGPGLFLNSLESKSVITW